MKGRELGLLRHAYALSVGTAAGATVGIVGWGGAQVVIPSLTLRIPVASYSQLSATGISLSSLSVSSVSSGCEFWRDGRVDVMTAAAIGLPAVFSARVGTRLAKRMSGDALELFFNGCSLVLMPMHFWIQQRRGGGGGVDCDPSSSAAGGGNGSEINAASGGAAPMPTGPTSEDAAADARAASGVPALMKHASFGLLSGMLSSLRVGGLPLTMSYLTLSTDLPHHEVQGTAVVALVPAIVTSAASRAGAIPPLAAACVAFGAAGGGVLGAHVALGVSEENLRRLFMGSLCVFWGASVFRAGRNIRAIYARSGKGGDSR